MGPHSILLANQQLSRTLSVSEAATGATKAHRTSMRRLAWWDEDLADWEHVRVEHENIVEIDSTTQHSTLVDSDGEHRYEWNVSRSHLKRLINEERIEYF